MRLSIIDCTTFPPTFNQDLEHQNLGIQLPRGDDERSLASHAESRLAATICVPEVPSIYPDGYFAEPIEPADRTQPRAPRLDAWLRSGRRAS